MPERQERQSTKPRDTRAVGMSVPAARFFGEPMTTAEREVLLEAIRAATVALQAAMRLLESPATAAAPVESDADRQRRLKADRQRRWRASRVASTEASQASTGPSTEASTASTETSTPASTLDQLSPSRACARSFSGFQKEEEEKNKEPVGLAARQGVRDVTETVASTPVASRKRSPNAVLDPAAVPEPVRRVWEAYRKAVGTRVTFTASRMALVRQRLGDGWSVEDLESCMAGYATSRWHFGENDRGQRYTDIELWLRDTRRIEQGLGLFDANVKGGGARPKAPKAKVSPNVGIEEKFAKFFDENPAAENGQWKF